MGRLKIWDLVMGWMTKMENLQIIKKSTWRGGCEAQARAACSEPSPGSAVVIIEINNKQVRQQAVTCWTPRFLHSASDITWVLGTSLARAWGAMEMSKKAWEQMSNNSWPVLQLVPSVSVLKPGLTDFKSSERGFSLGCLSEGRVMGD